MFTVFWAVLISLGLAVELIALKRKQKNDTLSEQFWRFTKAGGVKPPAYIWLIRLTVFSLFAWLAVHMSMGWLST